MKVNYRRIAAGRETARHYEGTIKSKEGRRKEESNRDRRELREAVFAR